jgi:hypothetical protein
MRKARFWFRRPSAAMVVAFLALIVASSGGAVAASRLAIGDSIIRPRSLSGNRLRSHTVGRAQINLTRLGTVPAALRAVSATTATSAGTAGNAMTLDGIAGSGYTRSDCNSTTGQVKGFALIPASPSFPTTFTDLGTAYNCSGQRVEARRIAQGQYEIRFLGSPVTIAVGNAVTATSNGSVFNEVVSFNRVAPGDFQVGVYQVNTGHVVDGAFAVLTP